MAVVESRTQTVVIVKSWVAPTTSTAAGSSPETASAAPIFVAEAGSVYQVVSVTERHNVVGSTTVMLVGALGSTPMGSAINLLASTIPLTAAVDVVNAGTVLGSAVLSGSTVFGTTATGPILSGVTGDGIGLRYTTPGNFQPVGVLTVVLQRM